jgi:hypothetical protein
MHFLCRHATAAQVQFDSQTVFFAWRNGNAQDALKELQQACAQFEPVPIIKI